MYVIFVGGHLEDNDSQGEKSAKMMQNGQQYGQQQTRPDWRSTEFIRQDQGPMSPTRSQQYNNNIPPPPPAQKEKKKSKFGFKDALKAGKNANDLANFDAGKFEALGDMNFDDVGGAINSAQGAYDAGKEAYDAGKAGYDLGKQGYDAYNQGRGQPQGRGGQVSQNRGGQRGPSGYNQGW